MKLGNRGHDPKGYVDFAPVICLADEFSPEFKEEQEITNAADEDTQNSLCIGTYVTAAVAVALLAISEDFFTVLYAFLLLEGMVGISMLVVAAL